MPNQCPSIPIIFAIKKEDWFWSVSRGRRLIFLVAIVLGLIVRFYPGLVIAPLLSFITFINIWLGLFNLLPVPPLDGSKLLFGLLPSGSARGLDFLQRQGSFFGIFIALAIAFLILPRIAPLIFNLITGGAGIGF